MIQFSKISTRYAKAIYEYAAENKAETTLYREFQTLAASFLSLLQMRDLLDNPTLEKPKKLAVLQAAAGENISPECLRVLQLIVDNDRVDYAYPIALMYEDVYKKAKNIVSVRLHSASPISDEAQSIGEARGTKQPGGRLRKPYGRAYDRRFCTRNRRPAARCLGK